MKDRDAWIDGLRAAAALMVFFHHTGIPGLPRLGLDAGILVFFTLSGYLLFRPFLERPVDVRAYAIRRLLRIMPAYLVAAVGIAMLDRYTLDPVGILTMSHTTVIVAWTLKIEVVFYATLPVIAWLARGRWQVLAVGAAASLAYGALAIASTRVLPNEFPAWAWAFLPGMLVAIAAVRRPDLLRRVGTPIVALAGLVLVAASVVPDIRYPDVPAAVGSALILGWLRTLPAPGRALAATLAAAGALSYSFYLWHDALIPTLGGRDGWVGIGVSFVVTAAIAATVYLLVERPAIALGRRLTAPRPPSATREPAGYVTVVTP